MDYRLVPMTREIVPQIAEIERACFSTPWTERMLLDELDSLTSSFIAAQAPDGTVLGYAGLSVVLDEGYINNIAVRAEYRRMGIADRLLGVFLRFAEAQGLAFLTLEVRAGNAAAIALYRKNGFEQVGRRPGYYTEPREDAVLMTRQFRRIRPDGAEEGEDHEHPCH